MSDGALIRTPMNANIWAGAVSWRNARLLPAGQAPDGDPRHLALPRIAGHRPKARVAQSFSVDRRASEFGNSATDIVILLSQAIGIKCDGGGGAFESSPSTGCVPALAGIAGVFPECCARRNMPTRN
jgi:hypothetical protein